MPLLRFSRRGTILLLKQVRAQLPAGHKPLCGLFYLLGQGCRAAALLVDQQRHPRLGHPEVLGHLFDCPYGLFCEVVF